MTAVIETRGLTKTYGAVRALDGLETELAHAFCGLWSAAAPDVNDRIIEGNDACMFVTLFCAVITSV